MVKSICHWLVASDSFLYRFVSQTCLLFDVCLFVCLFGVQCQPRRQCAHRVRGSHLGQRQVHLCGDQRRRGRRPDLQPQRVWWVQSTPKGLPVPLCAEIPPLSLRPRLLSSFPPVCGSPVPPAIEGNTVLPEDLTAVLDGSVNMECVVTGSPPPQLNWLRNGLPLPVSSHVRLLSAGQVLR